MITAPIGTGLSTTPASLLKLAVRHMVALRVNSLASPRSFAWCAAKPLPSPLCPPTQPAHLCKAVGAALPLVIVQAVRPVLQPLLHEQTLH